MNKKYKFNDIKRNILPEVAVFDFASLLCNRPSFKNLEKPLLGCYKTYIYKPNAQ